MLTHPDKNNSLGAKEQFQAIERARAELETCAFAENLATKLVEDVKESLRRQTANLQIERMLVSMLNRVEEARRKLNATEKEVSTYQTRIITGKAANIGADNNKHVTTVHEQKTARVQPVHHSHPAEAHQHLGDGNILDLSGEGHNAAPVQAVHNNNNPAETQQQHHMETNSIPHCSAAGKQDEELAQTLHNPTTSWHHKGANGAHCSVAGKRAEPLPQPLHNPQVAAQHKKDSPTHQTFSYSPQLTQRNSRQTPHSGAEEHALAACPKTQQQHHREANDSPCSTAGKHAEPLLQSLRDGPQLATAQHQKGLPTQQIFESPANLKQKKSRQTPHFGAEQQAPASSFARPKQQQQQQQQQQQVSRVPSKKRHRVSQYAAISPKRQRTDQAAHVQFRRKEDRYHLFNTGGDEDDESDSAAGDACDNKVSNTTPFGTVTNSTDESEYEEEKFLDARTGAGKLETVQCRVFAGLVRYMLDAGLCNKEYEDRGVLLRELVAREYPETEGKDFEKCYKALAKRFKRGKAEMPKGRGLVLGMRKKPTVSHPAGIVQFRLIQID